MVFRRDGITCLLQQSLIGFLLALAPSGWAGDFCLESAGARGGIGAETAHREFHQVEAFADFTLPWEGGLGRQFLLETRLDTSAGGLGDSSLWAAVITAGPTVILKWGNFPVSLEIGASPTLISRHEFENRNLGSYYQFSSHLGLNVDIASSVRLGYRLQHMSNGGFASPNPGLNMHLFGVSYLF